MSSVPGRAFSLTFSAILCLISTHAVLAQVIHAVPIPGDQFVVHFEQVSSGTYTFEAIPQGKFRTALSADFTALVIRSITQTNGWQASYRYDHLRIENQVEGASPALLEIWPTRMSINGVISYDTRNHPDAPPPLLVQILNGDFRAMFANQGDLLRIDECEKYHEIFPFMDFSQPFHETWMHRPPEPLQVGMKWIEDRPFRLWASRLTIPASQTYEVTALPQATNRPVSISFSRSLQVMRPRRIPIPVGNQIPPMLRFDALGPDIDALPPDLTIASLSLNSKGTVEYRLDRGFLASKQIQDQIDIQMEVPLPDGQETRKKGLRMDRATNLSVTLIPAGKFSEEARHILFGG
jgi:hypothetical protein